MSPDFEALVAGHICLDIHPDLERSRSPTLRRYLPPGRLVAAGPVTYSTGGAVSNTGLALNRLGIADTPGREARRRSRSGRPSARSSPPMDPAWPMGWSSMPSPAHPISIIINYPGVDRIFLHYPGANDTFQAERCALCSSWSGPACSILGTRRSCAPCLSTAVPNFRKSSDCAKDAGVTTSLDMAFPDPSSEAGQVDWCVILETYPAACGYFPAKRGGNPVHASSRDIPGIVHSAEGSDILPVLITPSCSLTWAGN